MKKKLEFAKWFEFDGVTRVSSQSAEGMVLYALVELTSTEPARFFSFVNWDEADDAYLEISADDFRIVDL